MSKRFDVIGKIALVQIDKKDNAQKIAKDILKINKNIESVYSKGKHIGRIRTQSIKFICGKKIEETVHKESGCLFKLNVKTCYFTPRLGTDRLEIAKKIKKNESVLVMFAGIAPYAIIISKHSNAKEIVCIELGKEPCKYAEESIKLNKIKNIKIIQGDVRKVKINKKFDRILMPRAQLKEDFLKEAFKFSKKGTKIHFYDFVSNKDFNLIEKEVKEKIEKKAKESKKKIKILEIKRVREIAPYKYHVRVDFKIL
jgi:tRNA (guanine37-N1)-methyltransferase